MNRFNLFLLFNLGMLSFSANAQKENNQWVFGHKNGLNFNTGTPVFFTSSNISVEGSSSVSDASGNLLFYSNGNDVWDATHTLMPNGTGILGNGPSFQAAGSATQGVGISQSLSKPNQYYLFTLDANEDLNGTIYPGYLRYSIIDMSLNGGKGDVVSTQKNIVVDSFMSEKMAFIKGADCSYWLLTHKHNRPDFLAFKIDHAGVHPAVVSTTGLNPSGPFGGELKASPDGKKVVMTAQNTSLASVIELSDFNSSTGTVSNTLALDATNNITRYGYSFSPDSKMLYVTNSLPSFFTSYGNILQFDISQLPNVSAVMASRYVVAYTNKDFNGLRLAPDGAIYVAMRGTPIIARIKNPNIAGVGCNYDSVGLSQPATALFPLATSAILYGHGLGLDALVMPVDTVLNSSSDTAICLGNEVVLTVPAGLFSYRWDDGNETNERAINEPGVYWVAYQENACNYIVDTFIIQIRDIKPEITIDEFELGTTQAYNSYQWYLNEVAIPGATNRIYKVKENGNYTVEVVDSAGCSGMSDVYLVSNVSVDELQQASKMIKCYPNPAKDMLFIDAPLAVDLMLYSIDGRVIKTEHKASAIAIRNLVPGIYLLKAYKAGTEHLLGVHKIVKQ